MNKRNCDITGKQVMIPNQDFKFTNLQLQTME